MERAESFCQKYFPNSSFRDIYSLDEFIDPSRVGDQEMVSYLTSIYGMRKEEMKVHYRLVNPSVRLDGRSKIFLLWQEAASKIGKTAYGEWCQKSMSAILGDFPNSPKFVGTKRRLEFNPADGTKADIGMTRYNLLMTMKDRPGLFLEEDLALCHVYPLEGKNKASPKKKRKETEYADKQVEGFDPPGLTRAEQAMSEVDYGNIEPLNTGDYPIDDLVRPGSEHWYRFTKIYTKNPKLMYAACNHCNTMLKLSSKEGVASNCGTKSLSTHSKTTKCIQKQLSGNSSTITEHGVVEI